MNPPFESKLYGKLMVIVYETQDVIKNNIKNASIFLRCPNNKGFHSATEDRVDAFRARGEPAGGFQNTFPGGFGLEKEGHSQFLPNVCS